VAVGAQAQTVDDPDGLEPVINPADTGPRPFRIWSREEFGAGPVVLSIARHPVSGFMYLGTGRGVSEYDGVRWRNIDPPDRGPTRGATIDGLGRIWTGSYNGVFLLQPDAAGELHFKPQPELLPSDLREVGYVRQIMDTPAGVCFTARQNVIVVTPDGTLRLWRAVEPFNTTWWMHGALHTSIANRGSFRLEDGGVLTKVNHLSPIVLAARLQSDGLTLLLTTRGPLRWRPATAQFEIPEGYGEFSQKKPEVTAAAFLRDGRSVFALESGDLELFDSEGTLLLHWPKVPTLAFNYCRQFTEDNEGGLWLAKHAGVIRIQLDPVPASAPPFGVVVRRVSDHRGRILYSAGGGTAPPKLLTPMRDERALRVEFAAPTYQHERQGGDKVMFRSRLSKVDTQWTEWSEDGVRDLQGMPFRDLTLEVEARRPGETVAAATSLFFRLTRSWWRTPWALALLVTVGGTLLVGMHRVGTRALRRRAGRLEEIVAARTAELAEKNAALAARNRELAALRQLDLDEKIAARVSEEKARLEVLRYQLNPHFLYNTLNSLYSLVLTAPPAAADMVLRLADFCRVALERHEGETQTVGTCFDRLTLYLEIEKIRWGPSLHVELILDPEACEATLPSFLVLPLLENAIKYGGATSPDELRVRLAARLVSAAGGRCWLEIEVANTGQWIEPSEAVAQGSTGIGLENIRQRLQQHYPGRHEFSTDARHGWVRITLRIEQEYSPLAATAEPVSAPGARL
jgi:signal transduction histidine kinase